MCPWLASPSKIASTRSRTGSSWCCSPRTGRARSPPAAPITIARDNDKNPVVALREIAEETQQADDLRERMIEANQTQIEVDEPEEDQMALLMGAEQDKPAHDDMTEENLLRQLMEAQLQR